MYKLFPISEDHYEKQFQMITNTLLKTVNL